jgi:acyl carrier protein
VTEDVLREILCEELGFDEGEITPDTDIYDDLGLDSLDIVQLVFECEERFGVEIKPTKRNKSVRTISEAAAMIDGLTED